MSFTDLRLRPLCLHDESEYRALQTELRGEGHRLGLQVDDQPSWDAFFWVMADQRQGFQLDLGDVAESPMVAITGHTMVGAAWFRFEVGPRGHLDLAVRPRYRRHGHGSSILTRALPVLRARGIDTATLRCRDRRRHADDLIERHGGRPISRPDYDTDRAARWYALDITGKTIVSPEETAQTRMHHTHA